MHAVLCCTVDVWALLAQTIVNINVISMSMEDHKRLQNRLWSQTAYFVIAWTGKLALPGSYRRRKCVCVLPWASPHNICSPVYICLFGLIAVSLSPLWWSWFGCPLYGCRLSLSLPLHPSCPSAAHIQQADPSVLYLTWDSTHSWPSL